MMHSFSFPRFSLLVKCMTLYLVITSVVLVSGQEDQPTCTNKKDGDEDWRYQRFSDLYVCDPTINCDWLGDAEGTPAKEACCSCGGGTITGVVADPTGFSYWDPNKGGNGHYYKLIKPTEKVTWAEARELAKGYSLNGEQGHLVTITSAEEQEYVYGVFRPEPATPPNGNAWIGLSDTDMEGEFKWVTSESFNYPDALDYGFAGNQPDNDPADNNGLNDWYYENYEQYYYWDCANLFNNGQDCVEMEVDGSWDDETCEQPKPHYIVEIDVVPSSSPTEEPTNAPTSSKPTDTPTMAPTAAPTSSKPTDTPTMAPTAAPTSTPTTMMPTKNPIIAATEAPIGTPTGLPNSAPTASPIMNPTAVPVSPTPAPSFRAITGAPTESPVTTSNPTTIAPTPRPTRFRRAIRRGIFATIAVGIAAAAAGAAALVIGAIVGSSSGASSSVEDGTDPKDDRLVL